MRHALFLKVGHVRALWTAKVKILQFVTWSDSSFQRRVQKDCEQLQCRYYPSNFDMTNVVSRDAVQEFSTHKGYIVKSLLRLKFSSSERELLILVAALQRLEHKKALLVDHYQERTMVLLVFNHHMVWLL